MSPTLTLALIEVAISVPFIAGAAYYNSKIGSSVARFRIWTLRTVALSVLAVAIAIFVLAVALLIPADEVALLPASLFLFSAITLFVGNRALYRAFRKK